MKLIHLTDPHLVAPGATLHGLDPGERLARCVADVNAHHGDADLCVITGDLADRGDAHAYAALRECLQGLAMPVRLVVGNHDHRERLRSAFPELEADAHGHLQSELLRPEGAFLFLDTVETGTHAGRYCALRQAWLAERLAANAGRDVYLFMHHPPFAVGLPALDLLAPPADECAALARLLAGHGRVRHLFFGHLHRPVHGVWHGIAFSTIRATSHGIWPEFRPDPRALITASHEPPAYAVVLIGPHQVTVHAHDFLDRGPRFVLGDAFHVPGADPEPPSAEPAAA